MQFYVTANAYNSYGGHLTLSLIPEFLLGDGSDFGPAVSELSVNFHFPTGGRPRRTLEQDYKDFHANRLTLPKVVIRRNRGQAVIDIASELLDGKDLEKERGVSWPLFAGGVAETVAALALLGRRLTAKDDFRLEEFLTHCRQAQARLPATAEAFAAFVKQCEKKEAERQAALGPWEKLGIDWRDFHPDARRILDDPFYWQGDNIFSPHGNDTGADLLFTYRGWLRRGPSGDPIEFYERLLRRWGYRADPSREEGRAVIDEAAVALAFAELKLRAACRPAVAALAREAIGRQRQEAVEAVGWPHRNERLQSLKLVEAKLPAGG